MPPPLDPALVRPRFPALARDAVYLDGPGGSQVPDAVIEAVAGHLRGGTANVTEIAPGAVTVVALAPSVAEGLPPQLT